MQEHSAPSDSLIHDLLQSLDNLFGLHPGHRTVHAKGVMCHGTFTPSPQAPQLTRAAHIARPSTRVVVRLSDFAGVPFIADNDPNGAGPRGFGIRFYLADHIHTDIVGHSHDGFPVRTGEEFLQFARAIAASGPNVPHPTPIESFLGTHPAALRFVQAPKPFPTSLARENYFGVSAFHFTNAAGDTRFGRYRIIPEAGTEYLTAEEAAKKSPNYLMDELAQRIAKSPIKFRIAVQLAAPGDVVSDSTIPWPANRQVMDLGTVTLTQKGDDSDPELRKIILDPRPGVDGIDASDDPLFEVRAAIYILSGRRRRTAAAAAK
jgi:catalase